MQNLSTARLARAAQNRRHAPVFAILVLPVGIEPTFYPPQGYVLSIERWERGVQSNLNTPNSKPSLVFRDESFRQARFHARGRILFQDAAFDGLVYRLIHVGKHCRCIALGRNQFLELLGSVFERFHSAKIYDAATCRNAHGFQRGAFAISRFIVFWRVSHRGR